MSSDPLDLGVWIDDPPRLVLKPAYLDRLREMPLRHVAVMLDGPEPGLDDARWTEEDLARLADELPDHDRYLTAWLAPDAEAIVELGQRLAGHIEALHARGFEGDVEPAGEWRERDVDGFRDLDGDGRRLDDAAEAIAEMLCDLPVGELELTTFPAAYRLVRVLVDALARQASPLTLLRIWLQVYPVLTRSGHQIAWDGRYGPVRWPREAQRDLRARFPIPERVELCTALSAYNDVWPIRGSSMLTAAEGAVHGGSPRLRWWSSKWFCRLAGHIRRRRAIATIAERLDVGRVTPPAPQPASFRARAVTTVEGLASEAKALGDGKAEAVLLDAAECLAAKP